MPETSTARPEVAAAACERSALAASGRPLLALTPHVEERVVDPDGEADSRTTSMMLLSAGTPWLETARAGPVVATIDVSATQQRDQRADERAEHEHQHDDRERDRDQPGLGEAALDLLVERLVGRDAGRLDVEARVTASTLSTAAVIVSM